MFTGKKKKEAPATPGTPEFPVILGVYSFAKETQIGLGDTAAKRETVTYWYVRQLAEDVFEVQPLNIYHVPSGVRKEIDRKEFLAYYFPEQHYYKTHTVPALASLVNRIAQGEKLLSEGNLSDAEKQFIKALMRWMRMVRSASSARVSPEKPPAASTTSRRQAPTAPGTTVTLLSMPS